MVVVVWREASAPKRGEASRVGGETDTETHTQKNRRARFGRQGLIRYTPRRLICCDELRPTHSIGLN